MLLSNGANGAMATSYSVAVPQKCRQPRRCWPDSASPPAPASPSTRCIAKKHFAVAVAADITLIVQVKEDQPTLRQAVKGIATTAVPLGAARSHDKGRNRDERRRVTIFDATAALAGTEWHPHLATIIHVERDVFTRSAQTGLWRSATEIAFDVANAPITATRSAEASGRTGRSRQPPIITPTTSPWQRTPRASAPTPACSPACAVSPSIPSRPTRQTPSAKTVIAPLSLGSLPCSSSSPPPTLNSPGHYPLLAPDPTGGAFCNIYRYNMVTSF